MTDLEIARAAPLRAIAEIAAGLGIAPDLLEPYGRYKAKLPLTLIDAERARRGKLVLVSAITPTPAGEGKTTMSIGLTEGLNRIGRRTMAVLREPSLGPVFGLKGGATGGGHAQVVPMEDINLHFTGDFNAVEKAHNLLAALIDNALQAKTSTLGLDARTVRWKRCLDMNDRALRRIVVGLGGVSGGLPRETGFDITAASEVMAILCMATSAADLKTRLGNIFVGFRHDRSPVFARDLGAAGAMAVLLKDALKPNLVQTLEGNPAILHAGPFGNIAQGTNSILATRMGLTLSDYVVTEAGFGFDLGGEKFLDLKCGYGQLSPQAIVMVVTVRALKHHGGAAATALREPNAAAVGRGLPNLERHLESVGHFERRPIVAINRFFTDTEEELAVILDRCRALGYPAAVADVWGHGGAGAEDLARLVAAEADEPKLPHPPLYDWAATVETKITTIAQRIYGAAEVEFQPKAEADLRTIARLGLSGLPICMAKTQKSLSDNPSLLGRPTGFTLSVREIEIAAGAGFLIPICGEMLRMPGLPDVPAAVGMDIDDDGVITGLF